MLRIFRNIANLTIVIFLFYFIALYIQERVFLNMYISKIEKEIHINQSINYENILAIRNYLIQNLDFTSPEIAKKRSRIGWSITDIISKRQGLCGEGSRLLFFILRHYGIDSRRVYLHGPNNLHVILELKLDNSWRSLETINGPSKMFKDTLDIYRKPITFFFPFSTYRFHIIPSHIMVQNGFANYSYFPFNGLFNSSLFRSEVYIHKPMPFFLTYVSESPPLMYMSCLILFLIILNLAYIKNNTYKMLNFLKLRFIKINKKNISLRSPS